MENKKIKQFISTLQTIAKELDEETSTPEVAEKTKATEAPAEITAEAASVVPYSEASETDAEHCYKSFELPDNITVQTDILKKSTAVVFDYFCGVTPPAGFAVQHIFKPNSGSSMFGNSFGLNVNETLSKSSYTDCFGDTYENIDGYMNGMEYISSGWPLIADNVEKFNDQLLSIRGIDKELNYPATWLYNGTVAKGFNKFGKLVFICDVNTNYAHIVYERIDSKDIITKIEQGNNGIKKPAVYSFVYSGNYLSYIQDGRGKSVDFKYDGGYLSEIDYPDGRKLKLDYNSSSISVDSSDDYFIDISCSSSAVNISAHSLTNRDSYGEADIYFPALLKWQITFEKDKPVNVQDIDGNCEYYTFDGKGRISEYCKEENLFETDKKENLPETEIEKKSFVTYADKRFYSEDRKDGKVVYRNTRVFIAPDSILNRTPYSNFNYSINYSLDECRSTSYNKYNNPVSESLSNKRLGQYNYLSYYKAYTYTEYYLTNEENTSYCLYTIDDGEEQDHKYYHQVVKNNYGGGTNLLKRTSYFEETKATKGEDVEEYAYNEAGQLLRKVRYNSLEPDKAFVTEKTYDDYGRVASETDPTGLSTLNYLYNDNVYKPYGVVLPNNNTEYHYFDDRYRTNKVVLYNAGESLENRITRENAEDLSYNWTEAETYSDTSNSIRFKYNKGRQLDRVEVNSSKLYDVSYNLRASNGDLLDVMTTTITNAKGEKFTCLEDKNHTYTEIKYGENTELKTIYRDHKYKDTETDGVSGETVKYNYDTANVLWWYTVTENGAEKYRAYFVYNDDGSICTVTQSGVTDLSYGYYYDSDLNGNLKRVRVATYTDVDINYDKLGRYTGRKITYGNKQVLSENIKYRQTLFPLYTPSGGSRWVYLQTELPSEISYGNGSYSYTYDDSGNITKIKDGDRKQITYEYDGANRLKKENNQFLDRTYEFEYDKYGNITSKKEYYYNGTSPISTIAYSYSVGKLTKFGTETGFAYDALGNPTTYRGKTLTWTKGKRLTKFNTTTFEYDGRGRRMKKNGIRYYYDYNDRLIVSDDGINCMQYFYDHNGVAGFKYGGAFYYYQRDIQNNVTAILDSNGNTVVNYTYDAWGNHTVSGSNLTLGTLNPFRYRSYFYDTETKLYYLKTRYYDPEVGRFINMDSVQYADPETVNGLNLYSYCGNNPVMSYDPEGQSWSSFWKGVGNWFKDNWVKLTIGGAFILAGAALTFFTAGMGITGLIAAGSALLSSAKAVGISMAVSAGLGTLLGGISGGWEGALKGFSDGLADGFMWGGIFAGSAQLLGGASKLLSGRNVDFSNSFNVLYGNRNSPSTTLLRINKAGRQLFRIDADIIHLWHFHYGATSSLMRIHRTSVALFSYLGITNGLKSIFGGF